jgi:YD repeat-containing protein
MMVLGLLLALAGQAAAQSGNSCWITQDVAGFEFNNFPAMVAAWAADGYSCVCVGATTQCNMYACTKQICAVPPANSSNETAPGPPPNTCPACTAQGSEPVNFTTGNVYIQQTDIRVPGLGGGLNLTRTWNSLWPTSQGLNYGIGLFGVNWTSTYEEHVYLGNDNTMKYARSDGSVWSFWPANPPQWRIAAPATSAVTLTEGDQYWTVAFASGEQRRFSQGTGNLIAIIDRNGNATTLSYFLGGGLASIADPAGRHLYFTYFPGTGLVQSVTSDIGLTSSYTYSDIDALLTVTEPDSQVFKFEYSGAVYAIPIPYWTYSPTNPCIGGACTGTDFYLPPLITAVKDAKGKIIETHTYDWTGRALTSSRYDGSAEADAVTLSYSGWDWTVVPLPTAPPCAGGFPCWFFVWGYGPPQD